MAHNFRTHASLGLFCDPSFSEPSQREPLMDSSKSMMVVVSLQIDIPQVSMKTQTNYRTGWQHINTCFSLSLSSPNPVPYALVLRHSSFQSTNAKGQTQSNFRGLPLHLWKFLFLRGLDEKQPNLWSLRQNLLFQQILASKCLKEMLVHDTSCLSWVDQILGKLVCANIQLTRRDTLRTYKNHLGQLFNKSSTQ